MKKEFTLTCVYSTEDIEAFATEKGWTPDKGDASDYVCLQIRGLIANAIAPAMLRRVQREAMEALNSNLIVVSKDLVEG